MKLEKDIYTTKEAAALIGLSPDGIRAAIQAGTLEAQKFGKAYIIYREDFADYLEYRERRDNGRQEEAYKH